MGATMHLFVIGVEEATIYGGAIEKKLMWDYDMDDFEIFPFIFPRQKIMTRGTDIFERARSMAESLQKSSPFVSSLYIGVAGGLVYTQTRQSLQRVRQDWLVAIDNKGTQRVSRCSNVEDFQWQIYKRRPQETLCVETVQTTAKVVRNFCVGSRKN